MAVLKYRDRSTGSTYPLTSVNLVPGTNVIRNGDMSIAQRGNGNFIAATSGNMTADGWMSQASGGVVSITRKTLIPGEISRSLETGVIGQSAVGDYATIFQRIEDSETLEGRTVSVSFDGWADTAGAKIGLELEQNFGSGGSTAVNGIVPSGAITLTDKRNRYSTTMVLPSTTGKTVGTGSYLRLIFWCSAGSNYANRSSGIGIQNYVFYISDVQLEEGSYDTPFERRSQADQLAWNQRYFQRIGNSNPHVPVAAYYNFGSGSAGSTTAVYARLWLPVSLRAAPTFTASTASNFCVSDISAAPTTCSAISASATHADGVELIASVSSGLTQFRPMRILRNSGADAYIDLSAEL